MSLLKLDFSAPDNVVLLLLFFAARLFCTSLPSLLAFVESAKCAVLRIGAVGGDINNGRLHPTHLTVGSTFLCYIIFDEGVK